MLLTDTSCLLGCKTQGTGTNINKWATCNDGYLLITDQTCLYQFKTKGRGSDVNKCATCKDDIYY